jgi:heme-degrading monooxygenase HmoA
MHARVSTYDSGSDEIVQGFDSQTDAVQQVEGFKGAYFLVDRAGGKAMSITLWESEEALQASAARADELRAEAVKPAGAGIQSVESYEVAIQL